MGDARMTTRPFFRRAALLLVAVIAVALVLPACTREAVTSAKYHCPMHPTYVSDKPGDCPICGMDLVLESSLTGPKGAVPSGQQTASPPGGRKILYYRNPMDPKRHLAGAGEGLDGHGLRPGLCRRGNARRRRRAGSGADRHRTPTALKLTGVQTAPAVQEHLVRTIRTVGTVIADESRIRHVHTKIAGWVEKL